MAKEMINGIQKKKILKRRNNKFIHKLIHYLKSDSYLFAPLFSSSSSVPKPGIEIREPTKDNTSFSNKVEDYLNSDCYMYASLLSPKSFILSPKGAPKYVRKLSWEVSRTSSISNGDKLITESAANKAAGTEKRSRLKCTKNP